MKKLIFLIAGLMLIVYIMPLATVGFTEKKQDEPVIIHTPVVKDIQEPDTVMETAKESSDYDRQTEITLLENGQVRTINLHDYLVGVVAAEMPASFPEEALKAQALAARTYTLYKMKLYSDGMDIPDSHGGALLCADHTHCKAFIDIEVSGSSLWGSNEEYYIDRITAAVTETKGLIAVYNGQPIAAVFHAASGEFTEAAVDVWGGDIPYLVSVESYGGSDSPDYESEVSMSQQSFSEEVLKSYPSADFSVPPEQWFKASNRSEAGGIIDVAVGGVRVTGNYIRSVAGLNSSNFKVKVEGDNLVFTTVGYGHGVGMSQYGARAMALEGAAYDEIIQHYFPGTELLLKNAD